MKYQVVLACALACLAGCNENRKSDAELRAQIDASSKPDVSVAAGDLGTAGKADGLVDADAEQAELVDDADDTEDDASDAWADAAVDEDLVAADVEDGEAIENANDTAADDTIPTEDIADAAAPDAGSPDSSDAVVLPDTSACTPQKCNDGLACTVDTCDAKGVCSHVIQAACVIGGMCLPVGPNPADACQACVAGGSAWTAQSGAACSDGNACTVGDSCAAGTCSPGAAKTCDDNDPCTSDSCDAVKGTCQGTTIAGCVPLNAVGCGKDGKACGGGKGSCSSGRCFWTDVKGYKWTLVPAGTFWMGCNPAVEPSCDQIANSSPQHLVETSAYWIGANEVTVANYQDFCSAAGSSCTLPANENTAKSGIALTWNSAGKAQYPVNYITWQQSRAYCQWLGGDLPSEAQWEKAARGGCELYPGKDCAKSEPKYTWGNAEPTCGVNAVFSTSKIGCVSGWPYGVGTGSAQGQSPYGAYDMIGNIGERVLDALDENFYSSPAASLKDPLNSKASACHVYRGGSCGTDFATLEASRRHDDCPYNNNGFFGQTYFLGARCAHPYP